jgi:DNA replication protein DnaC
MKSDVLLKSYLKELRLPTFLREFEKVAQQCGKDNKHYGTFLEELSALELSERNVRSIARKIRQATFPVEKELSDFKFSIVPTINKKQIVELSKGEFIRKRENAVFVGPPGVGKTHLAIAIGREVCRRGWKVKYLTASGLVNAYTEAREQKTVQKLEKVIVQNNLIIMDELGYIPFSQEGAENLFSFFSQCYERTSIIVTSNLPFSEWPQVFGGDERLAGALLDRLTHKVHVVEVTGDSYRLKDSLKKREKGEIND